MAEGPQIIDAEPAMAAQVFGTFTIHGCDPEVRPRTLSCRAANMKGTRPGSHRSMRDAIMSPQQEGLVACGMTTSSQVLGGACCLWHLPRHAASVARLRPQDRFRSACFRGSGHGDSEPAGKMARRLRSILLSDHCLRSQSSWRLQQWRLRQ